MMDNMGLREREFDAKKAYQDACKQIGKQMTGTENFKAQQLVKETYEVWSKLKDLRWGI